MAIEAATVAIADLKDDERKTVAKALVDGAPGQDKAAVVEAAAEELTVDQFKELQDKLNSRFPQQSKDRRMVFVTGIIAGTSAAVLLALIAWGMATSQADAIATATITLATGIVGAVLGGLFGAYRGGT